MNAIQSEIRKELVEAFGELENGPQFGQFDGMYGETIHIPPSEEAVALMSRVNMLIELSNLSKPINYRPSDPIQACMGIDYGMEMYFGACPCPGVPDYMWNPEVESPMDDPMGDYMGRNY